jgi:hypothetical protein
MKPGIVAGFLEKHPGKTLILSDVDARAAGDLAPLASLDCDIALCMQAKRLRGRYMIVPRSGTVVLRPNHKTFALIEQWRRACENAPYGDTDESQLAAALSSVEGLRIVNLQHTGELGGLVRHDSASKGTRKASHLTRLIARMWTRGSSAHAWGAGRLPGTFRCGAGSSAHAWRAVPLPGFGEQRQRLIRARVGKTFSPCGENDRPEANPRAWGRP